MDDVETATALRISKWLLEQSELQRAEAVGASPTSAAVIGMLADRLFQASVAVHRGDWRE